MPIVLPRMSFRSTGEARTITGPHSSIWSSRAVKNPLDHPPRPLPGQEGGKLLYLVGHPQAPGKGASPLCTPLFQKPSRPASRNQRYRWLLGLCSVALALFLVGCTGSNFSGSNTGWSPAAAGEIPSDTGSKIQAGRTVAASDRVLAVTNGSAFASKQTILIDTEQLEVASVVGNNLTVVRGANGTVAQNHEGGAAIYAIGSGLVIIFVGTKQGEVLALQDDGSGPPEVVWTFAQSGGGR